MLGTLVNTLSIIVCSVIGMSLKGGIPPKIRNILIEALGLSVIYMGISTATTQFPQAHPLLFIFSLVIGAGVGEWLDIEAWLEKLGNWMEEKSKKSNSNLSQGFVSATLIYCVGSMAILGSIESGINGNHSILYTKSLLDGVMSLILSSTLGMGVLLSCIPVFLYQGAMTVFAGYLQPFITEDMIREISLVGAVLISVIGTNILKITTIKVGNFLPAIAVPVIYYLIV